MAARRTPPRALAVFAATAALFGLGWYVRSFLISGDPVSPAGGPWLGYFLWDAADLAGQKEELATHGVGTALTRFPLAIIKAGANWLLIGLIAPILAWRDRVVWQLWALFVAYALFWFYATQVDRYLAPVLPIGALLTGIFLADLTRLTARIAPSGVSGRLRRPEISLVLATALLAIFVNDALTRAGKEARGWNRILAERQGFLAMQAANAARPRDGARMVQIGLDNARYFYDGELIGDWFGPGRYRQFWVEPDKHLISSSEMRSALQRFDARLLAISPVFKYDAADYARDFDVLMKDQNQTLLQLKAAP